MIRVTHDKNSWKDCIGNNLDRYIATGDFKLVRGVEECFRHERCEDFQRHPVLTTGELSRDHLSYGLILFIVADRWDLFFNTADKLKWKFNHKHSQRGMYLWVKSFYSAGWRTLFYIAKFPEMGVIRILNWSVRKWANVKPERSQEDWSMDITINRTDRQKKAFYIGMPAYALHNFAWQLHVLPHTFFNRLLKRFVLPLIGKHNYPVRHLLGGKIDQDLAKSYQSMTGSRFTTTLDELNDRDVKIRDPETVKEIALDKDYMLGVLKIKL